jgi:hypothetical protein
MAEVSAAVLAVVFSFCEGESSTKEPLPALFTRCCDETEEVAVGRCVEEVRRLDEVLLPVFTI